MKHHYLHSLFLRFVQVNILAHTTSRTVRPKQYGGNFPYPYPLPY
jgi:hypothetical protein